MKKNLILGALVLLLVIGGLLWYGRSRPAPQTAPGTASTTVPSWFGAAGPYVDHGTYYDIAVNYPTTTPLTASENEAALDTMRAWAAGQVTQFKTEGNFDHLTQKDIQMMGYDRGRKETLQITYLISTSPRGTPRTVSYIYTIYLDTLGAHGNTFFKTFTFDLQTGRELGMADLFVPGSDYPAKLSALSRSYLTENLGASGDAQMIDNGTTPDAKNFQNFFLDNGTLAILFAPYDVASYAAGPQTVRLPVSALGDILNPAYQ